MWQLGAIFPLKSLCIGHNGFFLLEGGCVIRMKILAQKKVNAASQHPKHHLLFWSPSHNQQRDRWWWWWWRITHALPPVYLHGSFVGWGKKCKEFTRDCCWLVFQVQKCQVCWEDFPLPTTTTTTRSNEIVKLITREENPVVGWLVGRLEARWWMGEWVGGWVVARLHMPVLLQRTLIKPHIIAYEWLLSYLFLFIHICCWVMADYYWQLLPSAFRISIFKYIIL